MPATKTQRAPHPPKALKRERGTLIRKEGQNQDTPALEKQWCYGPPDSPQIRNRLWCPRCRTTTRRHTSVGHNTRPLSSLKSVECFRASKTPQQWILHSPPPMAPRKSCGCSAIVHRVHQDCPLDQGDGSNPVRISAASPLSIGGKKAIPKARAAKSRSTRDKTSKNNASKEVMTSVTPSLSDLAQQDESGFSPGRLGHKGWRQLGTPRQCHQEGNDARGRRCCRHRQHQAGPSPGAPRPPWADLPSLLPGRLPGLLRRWKLVISDFARGESPARCSVPGL
jgi:hypothetical protein